MVDFIKPGQLPPAPTAAPTGAIPIDNGIEVQKVTPEQIVNAGRPIATEAEAIAGTNNTKTMTPLRTRQAIEATTSGAVALARAWAESPTPPDPLDPDSSSSKTWALGAETAADRAEAAAANFEFASLIEAQEGTNATHSMNPQRVRQYLEGGTYKPSLAGSADMPITVLLEQWVQPEWFGAKGDGVTDDGAAIAAAIATGRDVFFGRKVYLCGRAISLSVTGQRLMGVGGIVNPDRGSEIRFSHTAGSAVRLRSRSTGLSRIHIGATTGRMNSGAADGYGVLIGWDDVPRANYPFFSRMYMDDVFITNQPSHGYMAIGTLEYSTIGNVTVADCLGHGFVHDGGTIAGFTNLQEPGFWMDYINCRAIECAGNAFIIRSEPGLASTGITLRRPEALGCCWDPAKRISEWQMVLTGVDFDVISPDVEDQQYANTVTGSTGIPRLASATPHRGIAPSGTAHRYFMPYFSSLVQSMEGTGTVSGLEIFMPRIFAGTYGVNQNPAIAVSPAATGVFIKAQTSQTTGAAPLVVNQSVGAQITIDGIEYRGLNTTLADWRIVTVSPPTATIAGGNVSITSNKVLLAGEGGVADSLTTIRIGVGVNGYVGLDTVLMYAGQDITFLETVNIGIIGGGPLVLSATYPIVRAVYDGAKWWLK